MFSPLLKTFLLLGSLSALFIAIGYSVGGPEQAWFFFGISMLLNIGMYWFSAPIALKMAGARALSKGEYPQLSSDIESLCQSMGIPAPRVYVSPALQANAFATGRNPNHSAICFTQGILQLLNRDELMAVTAHELAHIKNRDVLIATIAAVLASAISGLGRMAFWFGGSREDRQPGHTNILMILLAPLAALLIQMAISRQREFAADETGARTTRRPAHLAEALEKIERSVRAAPLEGNPAFAPLYIENPFRPSGLMALFSTHPPTHQRVEKLLSMKP